MAIQKIGLDIGHSKTKMTFDANEGISQAIFPSVACPAVAIHDDREAALAAMETVEVPGAGDMFVGNTARVQGGRSLEKGLSPTWLESDSYMALAIQSARIAKRSVNGDAERIVVVGLPADTFPTQKDIAVRIVTEAFNRETGMDATVKCVPQPMGAVYDWTLDHRGRARKDRSISGLDLLVVDIGHFTTDIYHLVEGRPVAASMKSSIGVYHVEDEIERALSANGIRASRRDLEKAVLSGDIPKARAKGFDVSAIRAVAFRQLASKIADFVRSSIGDEEVESLDCVLLSGGGSVVAGPFLESRLPNVVMVSEGVPVAPSDFVSRAGILPRAADAARMSISSGFYKLASLMSRTRES